LIIEDQEIESMYIDEISKELEKMEIEEENNYELNKGKKITEVISKIEEKNNKKENNNFTVDENKINKDI
jgi:hypothetical protein